MNTFHTFAKLVNARFNQLAAYPLYDTAVSNDHLWETYLSAFPEGTDPLYRVNSQHNCNCCKQFIRNLGGVVSIETDVMRTVWDIEGAPYPYDIVASEMAALVRKSTISDIYKTEDFVFGKEVTHSLLEDKSTIDFNHFFAVVPKSHRALNVAALKGTARESVGLMKRGFEEIEASALLTVRELIESNGIYRGSEHLRNVINFMDAKAAYERCAPDEKEVALWKSHAAPFARFKNTVIGTLLTDLSKGVSEAAAVASFESKVAPMNYKRPTALVTPGMINKALLTIGELGLESALERRFANLSDVTINNVAWADSSVKPLMKGGLSELLMSSIVSDAALPTNPIEIGIDDFMGSVLKYATSMSAVLSNANLGNFVSITAPERVDVKPLFKWDNNFAWSYDGNVTDSIKEKVKRAGGNVTSAKLRISLAWNNFDDLDLHVFTPSNKRIYFGNKCDILDVDMNAGRPSTREAVENASFVSTENGRYLVKVSQYMQRESTDVGFQLEVESNGVLFNYEHAGVAKDMIEALEIWVAGGVVSKIIVLNNSVKKADASTTKWGVATNKLLKVETVLLSPNYWDGASIGNKHFIFCIGGCKNDTPTRGIYNEFLSHTLSEHSKVFELLGDKTKCPVTEDQLSGVGFSSTQAASLNMLVTSNNVKKFYKINF
jgi:uncharacterized protein YfaP (DUF2135 family)